MSLTSLVARRRRQIPCADGATDGADRIAVLLRREAPALLAYFTRRVRPTEDAADLLSETMIVAWRRSEAVPLDDQQARMWLFGVARNLLSTHRRGQHRREALDAELRAELAAQPQQGLHVAADARIERLHALIAELPALDREILTLAVWEGFTLAEIATLLGMPAGTVRSRYSRARAALRRRLEGQGG